MLPVYIKILLLIGLSLSQQHLLTAEEVTASSQKIFVHPLNFFRPPVVKPTSATVEFIPGVPPGWPRPPSTTRRPAYHTGGSKLDQAFNHSSTSTSAPYVLNPNSTTDGGEIIAQNHEDRGFIDWLLGIVGLRPPNPSAPENIEPAKNCPACTCGLTYKNRRIVGGVETQVNEYPWMVALMYNNRFYCGASAINNKYVLTAGHCINGFSKERLSAVFLDHDRSNHFETQTFTRSINKILKHRAYASGGSYNNDIALLQLDREIPTTGLLKPVCLPHLGKSYTGLKGKAVGWGATEVHGQVSSTLREVDVPILSNTECRQTGYGGKITDNMICAGYNGGMKDSCQGDSGGPLHVINGTHHHIVGIVSWGEGCAEANYPGVYTRVNRYLTWIKSNTKDACYCKMTS